MPENRGKLAVHRIKSIGPAALQGRGVGVPRLVLGAVLGAFRRPRGTSTSENISTFQRVRLEDLVNTSFSQRVHF